MMEKWKLGIVIVTDLEDEDKRKLLAWKKEVEEALREGLQDFASVESVQWEPQSQKEGA